MTERAKFDAAMKKVLSVSKQELQRRMDAEKQKHPKPSASRAPGASARS